MIGRVEHVWFWVADLSRAIAFYTEVLGLRLVRREGDEWAELDAGPIRLALHAGAGDGREPGGTVVFEVDDLDETRFAMQTRGASFGDEGEVDGIARFASFMDPDGNRMQLIERYGEV
ncbi:MAG TPA: VOC family protein [Actinomycetota bacterium]|nr:VOC family protein [Actinomycetota bacterium]